jgi:hypothetical protein
MCGYEEGDVEGLVDRPEGDSTEDEISQVKW